MRRSISFAVCALSMALVTSVGANEFGGDGTMIAQSGGPAVVHPDRATRAGSEPVTGTVTRIDAANRVIVLEGDRMFRLTEDGAVLVDNRQVEFGTLIPGAHVVLRSAQPVTVRDGTYVVVTETPSAGVTVVPGSTTTVIPGPTAGAPAPPPPPPPPVASSQTTVVTTVTPPATAVTVPPAVADGRVTGTVARIDQPAGVVVFSDGRTFQTGGQTVILLNDRPVTLAAVQPGMVVTVNAANPVVYRDGRYVMLNTGFRDPDTASSLGWDAEYEGYGAETSNAGMGIQAE